MLKIAPSILSSDFSRLKEELESISLAGADWAHIDVMDNHFVPNLTVGAPVIKSLRKASSLFLDVHLMITSPEKWVKSFCSAGADLVTLHVESSSREGVIQALEQIKEEGKLSGLSLKPGTPAEALLPFSGLFDLALVMTVEPGFGGQSFMESQLPKISRVRELFPSCLIEVDGGINPETGRLCAAAGADVLVAGSFVFSAENRTEAIASLRCE